MMLDGTESNDEQNMLMLAAGNLHHNKHVGWIYTPVINGWPESFWGRTPTEAMRAAIALRGDDARPRR